MSKKKLTDEIDLACLSEDMASFYLELVGNRAVQLLAEASRRAKEIIRHRNS
jgi:hypothetical protein